MITICTAFHASHQYKAQSILNLNYKLTDKECVDEWVVSVSKGNYKGGLLKNFRIIQSPPQLSRIPIPYQNELTGNEANEICSFNHGRKLNYLLPHIHSRFVLFIDPDYFLIVSPRVIVEYMKKRGLSFFGSTYHPNCIDPPNSTFYDVSGKYYPFPCVWCMLIDLQKVDLQQLDFLPGYNNRTEEKHLMPHVQAGSRIMLKFKDKPHECVIPGCRLSKQIRQRFDSLLIAGRHYTNQKFADLGLPDIQEKWEEFFWNDRPFAIHTRTRNAVKHTRPVHKKLNKDRKIVRQRFVVNSIKKINKIVKKCREYNGAIS